MDKHALESLLGRVESLLARWDARLAPAPPINWAQNLAARWLSESSSLRPIAHPQRIAARDLLAIDEQKKIVEANTRQFVRGRPANNVLLTGARGTGKSSLVKAMLTKFSAKGLRLVEVDKAGLIQLPELFDLLSAESYRYILFCDDLSFAAEEPGYARLKAALDGSLAAAADNILIYATSNRRHLMPEFMGDNEQTRHVGEEVHPAEAIEEKVSLSDRFGLWVSFHPMEQDAYLVVARHWAAALGAPPAGDFERQALQWSLARGSRSGRTAWQFARDWAGRMPR